jgi:hypothetical protein
VTPAGNSGCDEIRQALGVYVVGAIDPAERYSVDRHLACCSSCRDELAGLAGLPALLGRVTLEEAERGPGDAAGAVTPPERLLDSMLDEMAIRRNARRRRSVLLGAGAVAASVVVLVGAGAGVRALVSGPAARPHQVVAGPTWRTDSVHESATKISASVRYRPQRWGTELNVWLSGVRHDTQCQLWVTDASGHGVMAGSWHVSHDGRGDWYPGSTTIAASEIESFRITSQGKTLVSVPS